MAYTTTSQTKRELPYNYQDSAIDKLTEDGYIDIVGNFNEASFLAYFVNQTADFMDGYAGGPFQPNGILDKINKILAVYEIEMYLVSSQQDRVVSVTIYNMWKNAMKMLDAVRDGDIPGIIPIDSGVDPNDNPFIVESCCDDPPITQKYLDEFVAFDREPDREMPC